MLKHRIVTKPDKALQNRMKAYRFVRRFARLHKHQTVEEFTRWLKR